MTARNFLKEARDEAKLTLEDVEAKLAEQDVKLSAGQLSRLERGESDVLLSRLEQLGQLYKWTPGQLLEGRQIITTRHVLLSYSQPDRRMEKMLAKALKERPAEFEIEPQPGQSGAPILDAGGTYLVALWTGGAKGKTQTKRALVVEVQMPLARIRDEKTGVESVINLTSPAFAGATRIDK